MRKRIDDIEIKEPPIKELKKSRSCVRRTCCTGFGCAILFLIAGLVFLRFVTTPREKELKYIPETFPKSVPIYNLEDVEKITFISGDYKRRGIEIATYVPKRILSSVNTKESLPLSYLEEFLNTPITDDRDTLHIEWTELSASPEFIAAYYQNELRKSQYEVRDLVNNSNIIQFSFKKGTVDGIVIVQDNSPATGTDIVSLITHYQQ